MPFSFCNSSLNKSQSKLPDRRPRACHHTQLWEKVPGHPYHVRNRRKAPPQKHFAAYFSRDLHPSLASTHRLHSHSEAVRLGSVVRGTGSRAASKEETRIRVCALVLQVLQPAVEGLGGGESMVQGASWTQGMCEGHSSRSIDMRLLVFGPWTGGTLLDGAYS